MTSNRGILLAAAVLLVVPLKAFSWGRTGHESIALIAKQNLNPTAEKQVKSILGTMTMDQAAVWPDTIKLDPVWEHTRSYHYSDISDGFTYWSALKVMPKIEKQKGDLVRALLKSEDIIRDPSSSKEQKKWALSFMIHFIGDLHQPLHAGRPEDRGGNDIKVEYFGKKTNLHSVWDSYIIQSILNPPKEGEVLTKVENPTLAYLKHLKKATAPQIKSWQASYIMDWFDESYSYRGGAYKEANAKNKTYQKKYSDIVDEQILKAGYRLAGWLNAIFTKQEFGNAYELREQMWKIVGNPDSDIILEPHSGVIKGFLDFSYLEDLCEDEHQH